MKSTLYQKVKFKELCANVTQRIDNPRNAKTDYYVGLEHLDSEEPRILRHGNTRDVNAAKLWFENGDILFGRRRWYLRKIAVADGRDGICSTDILVLRPKYQKITKGFLQILMLSDEFYRKGLSISAGSMSPRIRWKELAEIYVFIPSIPEQEKIVGMISRVDDAIAKTQHLLSKLKNYKESKSDVLLTRGIGHKRFKKVKWLFGKEIEIPEEWRSTKFGSHVKMAYGFSLPEKKRDKQGSPVYGSGGIIGFYSKPIVEHPAVIVPRKGSLENVFYEANAFFPIDTVYFITKNETTLDLQFLFYYIKNMRLKNFAIVTSNPGINRDDVYSLPILILPLSEQQKIASILSEIDVTIKDANDHLSNLKAMRKGIINEKLTPPKRETKVV